MIRCIPARKPLIDRHYLTPDVSCRTTAGPRVSPVAPPRDRASSILFTRVGLRKNSKATYCPLGLRKNFVLQCTGFTLGQFTVL